MSDEKEYWAWWDNKDQAYHYVYRSRVVVGMCSPDGFEEETKRGEGKVVKVKIETVSEEG